MTHQYMEIKIKELENRVKALEQESCINEEQEQIDFIQPKKVVGKLISVDVLDKIRAEIEKQEKWLFQQRLTAYNVDIALNAIKAVIAESEE